MVINCPLCLGNNKQEVESLCVKDLQLLSKINFNTEFEYLYKGFSNIYKCKCLNCDLLFYYPTVEADEYFYSIVSRHNLYYPYEKAEFLYAEKYIKNDSSVLEIGCGAGTFGEKISNYIGIDINKDAIKKAKEKGLNVYSQTIDEHFEDNTDKYDIVCAFQTVEHVANTRGFISNAVKCLKENGKLIIAVPSEDSYLAHVQNHLLNLPPHHVTRWTDKALESLERFFPIKLIALHHESVQDIHLETYGITFYTLLIKKILRLPHKTIDINPSFPEKIIYKLSCSLYKKTFEIFQNQHFRPNGHTVTAVFQKTNN
ncbi:MAG: class I SAM-dependent methyltransferase [Promethearchaeota archaeon]|jgi:2-polyprenyl-3-methyl-5-hydroxy-6-metoxy-1,4-benzoquinol methylase